MRHSSYTQPRQRDRLVARITKRDLILGFFLDRIKIRFRTDDLHLRFGTAFRTRVSELNRDLECPITIRNRTERLADGKEASWYWAELRKPESESGRLFPDDTPLHHLDLG